MIALITALVGPGVATVSAQPVAAPVVAPAVAQAATVLESVTPVEAAVSEAEVVVPQATAAPVRA